ncbi:MAG TPA: histidine kinase dimerization/phospho-acceptor domain-containing protein [Cyclobacteriaceae bacterium]|nr:histidine kinase dimerization/phospho-acceptor domain-containing protein [Cyclobacteriaceae bacterium]
MKLLNRTLLGFLLFSVAVLLIATPVLYLVINNIIISKVDETLLVHKKEIETRLQKVEDISQWEDLDGEVFVEPTSATLRGDSIYTVNNSRVLSSIVEIKGTRYELEARISLVESDDLIRALVLTQVILLVVLIAGMLMINWWNSKTIWRPFYRTLGLLSSFNLEKNSTVNLPSSSITEFNDLNAAIDELIKRDQQAYKSQREFTENAAHEMQTPLAVFQSKLDLLLQAKPSEQQAPIVESLLDATQRLNRLNKALLLLSKIDNRQFSEGERVDLAAITSRLIEIYKSEAAVTVTGSGTLKLNATLADILLSNLISNAFRHTTQKSEVVIKIGEGSWTISNPGAPLPIPADRIFERFQKGTSNNDSLGLGLAIAKKICDSSGLTLTYLFSDSRHHFIVKS